MKDILSTYFTTNKSFKNNNNNKNSLSNSKKKFSKYGLIIPNDKIEFKLPKIYFNTATETGPNSPKEELKVNKIENNSNKLFTISKLEPYKYNKKAKYNNKLSNSINNNKIFTELNESEKIIKQKKIVLNPISIKENNNINDNCYNNRNLEANFHQYTDRNERRKNKEEIINEYVSILLDEDKNKNKNNKLNLLNNIESEEKYTLKKSIDPTKYIKNMFLDESGNNNVFKTSKIQIDCFNGNEKLRNDSIKQINSNNMHNYNTNSLKIESNDNSTKSLIDEMFKKGQKLNNFYFGKQLYKKKFFKINNNSINIKKFLERRNEKRSDVVYTLDDTIKNAVKEKKDIENNFYERHKLRGRLMRKIRQFCDNYDGLVRRASTFDNNIRIIKNKNI